MPVIIRLIEPDEVPAFVRSLQVPFLAVADNHAIDYWTAYLEPDRTWVAVDGDRIVGNCCVFSRDVTVPVRPEQPASTIPLAAVSGVGVHPTHRRRGLLRRMMGAMFDDAYRRGEAVTGLLASESGIYGRFGYGLATRAVRLALDTDRSAFERPGPDVAIRLLDPAEAALDLPGRFDRLRRRRAGEVSRDEATWHTVFVDRPENRRGAGGRMYAVCDDGFVCYRARALPDAGRGETTRVEVRELYGATADIESALWRFVLDLDLADEVWAWPRPVDDPIAWRLADPRRLRTLAVADFLWLGVLDTAAALRSRGYAQEGRLVLRVVPPLGPPPRADQAAANDAAVGAWVLEVGGDGVGDCRRAAPADAVDVAVDLSDLGALYLGGVTASTLAAAGRIAEERPGGLRRADQLLATTVAPFTATAF